MSYTAPLQETIHGARARGVAVLIESHLNLLLKSPFDGLRRGSRATVLQSDNRHSHANCIALSNEEGQGHLCVCRHSGGGWSVTWVVGGKAVVAGGQRHR